MPPDPVPDLASRDLRQRLDRGEPLTLLDVREPKERAFCSIPVGRAAADLHIPMRQVPSHLEELQAAVVRGPLVVYCHHGVRSMAVAEWLVERGLSGILNLKGGIDAWSREVDPRVPQY